MDTTEFTVVPQEEMVQQGDDSKIWKSCCLLVDKDAVVFLSTMVAVFVIIGFSCYQLVTLTDCHSQNTYVAILSSLIGVLLPSPIMKKE